MTVALALALTLALPQTPAPASSQTPAPQPPTTSAPVAPARARRPAPTSATVQVRVTDRTGAPAEGVRVTAEGPVSRDGVTDASGMVQFRTVNNGAYRIRASHEKFITLEKDVTVRGGAGSAPIELALSAAPPPPAPAAPDPEPARPPVAADTAADASGNVKAGDSRVLSIADLAERSLSGRDPVKIVPVSCSGLDTTQLIVLRQARNSPPKPDTDQMLYVVAGEATLAIGGHEHTVTSGWFALVPRGVPHTITRRGRNPVVVLSTEGGQPCTEK